MGAGVGMGVGVGVAYAWHMHICTYAYRLDALKHEVLVDVVDIGLALAENEHLRACMHRQQMSTCAHTHAWAEYEDLYTHTIDVHTPPQVQRITECKGHTLTPPNALHAYAYTCTHARVYTCKREVTSHTCTCTCNTYNMCMCMHISYEGHRRRGLLQAL